MNNQNETFERAYSFQNESKNYPFDEKEFRKWFLILSEKIEMKTMLFDTKNSTQESKKQSPYQTESGSTDDFLIKSSLSRNYKSDAEKLKRIIDDCYFEPGILSEADLFFDKLEKEYSGSINALQILSYLTNNNLQNEHILEGILHILSFRDYEQLDPFGLTISIACCYNHSPIITDLLISNFEKWDSIECIGTLSQMNIEYEWIANYRDEVLETLRRKAKSQSK